jgi:hypothetical protein
LFKIKALSSSTAKKKKRKDATLKRVHTVWFQLHDSRKDKILETVKRSVGARSSEREYGMTKCKGQWYYTMWSCNYRHIFS